jgi:hypothetical protein
MTRAVRDAAFHEACSDARRFFEAGANSGDFDDFHPVRGWASWLEEEKERAYAIVACWPSDPSESDRMAELIVSNAALGPDMFYRAKLVAAEMLANGMSLPTKLAEFVCGVLAEHLSPPQRRGYPPMMLFFRNRFLFVVAANLYEWHKQSGLTLYRPADGDEVSVFDAIARGWQSAEMPKKGFGTLSYSSVCKAWEAAKAEGWTPR